MSEGYIVQLVNITLSNYQVAKEEGRLVHVMGNYFTTPFAVIEAEIKKIANYEYFYLKNIIKDSVIIGFSPVEVRKIT